jgi:hypothetical protein
MMLRFIAVLLTGSLTCMAAWAAPKAAILEYGYYQFTGKASRIKNERSTSGYVRKGQAKLVKKTTQIPIEKGRLFGFRFRIEGVDSNVGVIPLELVVEHPPMKKPDGSVSTGYRYPLELKAQNGVVEDKTGYSLNQDYELVEGEWHFQYRFMNKPLLEQRFTTYKPSSDKPQFDMMTTRSQ